MKRHLLQLLGMYRQEFAILFFAIIVIIIFIPIFTYLYFASDLQSKESIMNRNNTGIVLLDRRGEPFFRFYQAKYSQFVPLKDIPKDVQEAIIVAEDKDFYKHPGFSVQSMLAAMIANVRKGDLSYGGSTITQQLVKNALLHPKKSFLRKYQEIILSYEVERRFSKEEILEMYLNSVYFGEGAFGIESAADTYFAVPAKELNVSQASMLAGLLTAPSVYSPLSGNKEKSAARQEYVLRQMVQEKYITEKEKQNALQHPLAYKGAEKEDATAIAPHFALMVRDELIRAYGEERVARSGFVIHTTLDLSWQKQANEIVEKHVDALAGQGATNGAAVVIDPKTGEVRVLVGSKNWFNEDFGKYNMANTPRQPGSSFKPIVYALALEKRMITPATILRDVKTTFPGNYSPKNYDERFRGSVLVRRSLANSLNVPAVEVMQKVGVSDTLKAAKNLGITTLGKESDYGLSLVLGTGAVKLTELTNVYATFANEGKHHPVTIISKIVDKQGDVVYQSKSKEKQVMEPGVAFLISSILSDTSARAEMFGSVLNISRPAAVKTGTTEEYRDALTVGYTPSLAVGVWVGNNNNKPMAKIAGSLGAAPIWKELMETYLKDTPVEQFIAPDGVVAHAVCPSNGYLASNAYATSIAMQEYFLKGTGPTRHCVISPPREREDRREDDNKRDREERREERAKEAAERIKERIKEMQEKQEELQEEMNN